MIKSLPQSTTKQENALNALSRVIGMVEYRIRTQGRNKSERGTANWFSELGTSVAPIQICCTLQSTALLGKVSDLRGRENNSKHVCQFNRQQVFAVMPCNSALRGNEFFHIVLVPFCNHCIYG